MTYAKCSNRPVHLFFPGTEATGISLRNVAFLINSMGEADDNMLGRQLLRAAQRAAKAAEEIFDEYLKQSEGTGGK